MKKGIFIVTLLIGLNSFSQKGKKFKPGVVISEIEKIADYKKPASILFVFQGHTHMINNFLDLKWTIRKTFKKKMKREFRNFKLNFNFNLNAQNTLKSDLGNIPTKKYNKKEYESICYISISDFQGWNNNLIHKRKMNYNLNVELKDINQNQLIKLKLNVNSYYTITTQNKNSSKLIYKTIMNN